MPPTTQQWAIWSSAELGQYIARFHRLLDVRDTDGDLPLASFEACGAPAR